MTIIDIEHPHQTDRGTFRAVAFAGGEILDSAEAERFTAAADMIAPMFCDAQLSDAAVEQVMAEEMFA